MANLSSPLSVLVTGAAGGLGRVIATAYLDAGSRVAICDVNQEQLAETSALWAQKYADRFIVRQADVSSIQDMEALVQAIASKFGRLDILINNAAILDKFDPAGTCSLEMWNKILQVNLTGAFISTKVAVNAMSSQSPAGGTIINMGSNASFCGIDGGLAYTVSKHGVLALTRNTAAFYLQHNITCTMLQLGGLAATNITDSLAIGANEEGLALLEKHVPGFEPGFNDVPLEDVAKFCVFLADREIAKTLNGASVPFNRNWPAGI
ncbi:short chain dehydrogenase [Fusarium sporotrichioides]|uniref:Short chain dehydrogenase n=1 Tax=Fusarium sporotrichioides TaxID=5514 RepID=A0A395S8J0_FUSSP|nr:short chain dehydrogenase [Fusarium sporotrichioides]